jgi:tRNA 2-thiocytidine biosynthesis protein TtcA
MKLQKFLSPLRRAIEDYQMIKDGDRIAVGLSGGKDSMALLRGLSALRRFYPHPFELCAITIDMGYAESDFAPLSAFCAELEVPFLIEHTDIKEVVFDIRKEENPCSLCAKMRRGALNEAARKHGYHKVALGHHFDDAVETFFLSLFYEGRVNCFSPVTYLSRTDVTVIRPMIYLTEGDIRSFVSEESMNVQKSLCPADGYTKREEMKNRVAQLNREYPDLKKKVFTAIQNSAIPGWNFHK